MEQSLTSTTRRRGHQHHPRHATRRRLDASSRGPAQCGTAGKSSVVVTTSATDDDAVEMETQLLTTTVKPLVTTPTTITTTSRHECRAKNNNFPTSRMTVGPGETNESRKTSLNESTRNDSVASVIAHANAATKLNVEESDDVKSKQDCPKNVQLRPARCGPKDDDENDKLWSARLSDDETRADNRLTIDSGKTIDFEVDEFEREDCRDVLIGNNTSGDGKIVSRRSAGSQRAGTRESPRGATRSRTKDNSTSPEPEHAVARARGDGNSDDETPNVEEDPELAELAKLRCPSERTEVQAEREARRRKRCADYPGLAFGSSIFSSDTMMKFSLIRNELKNIMGNQLKRVSIHVRPLTMH